MTENDPISDFLKRNDGYLNYGNQKAYTFETGIINRYSFNAEVGSIPTIDTNFEIWGEVKTQFDYPPAPKEEANIPIVSNGDIEVVLENCLGEHPFKGSSELITSFSFDVDINWKPIMQMSSIRPAAFSSTAHFSSVIYLLRLMILNLLISRKPLPSCVKNINIH